jgi:hypothetical protein
MPSFSGTSPQAVGKAARSDGLNTTLGVRLCRDSDRRAMMRAKSILTLAIALLAANVEAQEKKDLPFRGVVNSPTHPGLMMRAAPPEVTSFSYSLAKPVCGVGNGSTFVALDQSYLANGEVWLQVYFTSVSEGIGKSKGVGVCTLDNAKGWMVAKSKGRWLVSVLERNINLPQTAAAAAVPPVPASQSASPEEPSTPVADEQFSSTIFLKYAFMIIGTALAVCVVAIERSREIHPRKWCSWLVGFEFMTLAGINTLATAVVVDELFQVDDPDLLFRLFKLVQGSLGGYILFGFLLSIVLSKFMSFAKS